MEKQWKQWKTIFLGSKITADGETAAMKLKDTCSLEESYDKYRQHIKSRNITLPTKISIVKVTVFPVVMFGCESWTIKKAEHWRTDAFELWCWRRLLWVPWTARKSNQLILKEITPEYSLEGLMLKLKLQYFGYVMRRTDSLVKTLMLGKIEDRRIMTKDEMVGWHHQLPELAQIHVHQVSDAIQPSHPLSSPSPPAPNPFQHQGLFQWVNPSHEVAKVLEFQLQHQFSNEHPELISLGWTDWISFRPRDSQESSPTPQFKSINSSALSFLHSTTLTPKYDYWKNNSLN